MGATQSADFDDYRQDQELGEGAFGKVYKVHHKNNPSKFYAAKVIHCSDNDELNDVVSEIKALTQLNHTNIIKLVETICKQKEMFTAEIYLVMEYCSGGHLGHHLDQTPYNPATNLKWMRQLVAAVNYIHHACLVHRDLKPDNVLLNSRGDIKVGDFGLSRKFSAMRNENETWESYYMKDGCGTLNYIAPEVFEDHYTEKADIFALGILLYAIVERKFVETAGKRFYGVFIQRLGMSIPLGVLMYPDNMSVTIPFNRATANLASVIGPALLRDHKQRPTALKILEQLKKIVA